MVLVGIAMGFADLAGALAALVFVRGFFRGARWRLWLGTTTLTISVYAMFVYDCWTLASGAWTGAALGAYVFVNLVFVPVVVLFALFCRWGVAGRLG